MLGARRSLLTLVQNLAGTRVESLVVVPAEGDLTKEFQNLKIPYEVNFLPPWRKGKSWWTLPGQVSRLQSIIHNFKPDVIHCNEIYSTPHALAASAQKSAITESWTRLFTGRAASPPRIPVVTHMRLSVTPRLIRNYYLGDASRLIAVSHGAAADFNDCPWRQEKVRVVYNGIDLSPFAKNNSSRKHIRESLGWDDGNFVIGQFGLMMPRKRPETVIVWAGKVLEQVPHARFLFIGDASPGQQDFLDSIKRQTDESPAAHAIKFLPFQTDIGPYFSAIDLNLLLSNEEGFGRVIIEAAGAGVPSIGSRVGGIPELIEHEKTGFLIGQPGESDSFDDCGDEFVSFVSRLAGSHDLLKRMGAVAKTRAEEMFTPDAYADGCVNVFHEAIAAHRLELDEW